MRTTYFAFIDEGRPEGALQLTTSDQDLIDFGVGISSHIGIGTENAKVPIQITDFSGTGLRLEGIGSDYAGMQFKTLDSSNALSRNIFIDTVNETGAAIANQVGGVQSDGGSHWRWETQPPGDRTDRRVERLRIDANGNIGVGTDDPTSPLTIFKQDPQYVGVTTLLTLRSFRTDMSPTFPAGSSIKFDNYDGNYGHEAFIEVIAPYSHSGSEASREKTADFIFKQTNNGTLNTTFTIQGETGSVGIGTTTPETKLDVIGNVGIEGDLLLGQKPTQIVKLNGTDGNLDVYSDATIDFIESDNDKVMVTFDINTTHNDARIYMEGDSDTYFNHPGDNQLGFTVGGNEVIRIRNRQVVFQPMTTAQRNAQTAQEGGVIYNSSTNKLQVYNGSAWVDLH